MVTFCKEAGRFEEAARVNFEKALAIDALNKYAYGGAATAAMNLSRLGRLVRKRQNRRRLSVRERHAVIPPLTFLGYSSDPGIAA